MAVGKRLRFEVFKRDGFQCQYCGRTPPLVVLNCDHIEPVSGGGGDDEINLITSCYDCNSGKSDVPLGQVTRPIAAQMAEARERKEQVEAYGELLMELRHAEDSSIDGLGTYWNNQTHSADEQNLYVFGQTRQSSVRTFLKKIPYAVVLDSIDVAMSRWPCTWKNDERTWRYFCGICWHRIREAEGQ